MKIQKLALALVLGAAATGCATVTRGTAQEFTVETTPTGAAISMSNGYGCSAAPCTFRMPRKHAFTVTATMDGYQPAQALVSSEMSAEGGVGLAGNVLIGGLIGVGVDATSGALNDLRPNPLHLTLTPIPAPAEATTVSLTTEEAAAAASEAVATDAPAEAAAEPAPEAAAASPSN